VHSDGVILRRLCDEWSNERSGCVARPVSQEGTTMDETRSRSLTARASRLRAVADTALEPLAIAYRRRAAELELQAAVLSASSARPVFPRAA